MQDRRSYLNHPRSPAASSSSSQAPCPNEEFGTRRTVIVLVIIVGCFAVVWPKLFYPMLVGNTTPPAKQSAIKQERPLMMNPVKVHPALKERGRAIYGADQVTTEVRRKRSSPFIVEGRPGPIPGRRPSIGGPGQFAPSKISNYGLMGILMPIYTIAFIIFFTYIVKQIVYKKNPDTFVGSSLYPPCDSDEQFEQQVFQSQQPYCSRPNKDSSQIGWEERDTRDVELDQLRKRLRETELAMERIVSQMAQVPLTMQSEIKVNGASANKEEEQNSVTIMGIETRASCENGGKWSRPDSPVLHHPQVAVPKEFPVTTQQIFLEGSLPAQSQILVADSATEAQTSEDNDSSVILAGKMTLSVISFDSEPGTGQSSNFGRSTESWVDEERRTSSNLLEEFDTINSSDLEDQIDNIIEEAGNAVLHEDTRPLAYFDDGPQSNEVTVCNTLDLDSSKEIINLAGNFMQALLDDQGESPVILKDCLNMDEEFSTTKKDNNADLEQTKKTANVDTISKAQKNPCEEELNKLEESSVEEILPRELQEDQFYNEVVLGLLEDHNNQSILGFEEEDYNEKTPDDFPDREETDSEARVITDHIECESEGNDIGKAEPTDSFQRDVLEEERVNGLRTESLNDAGNIEIVAGSDSSEGDLDDDEEELEEIIEYVDNTDEESEEIVEINGNENQQINENGTN